MINKKVICKVLGLLLYVEAAMMLACLIMSACYGEDDFWPFLIALAVNVVGGAYLRYKGRGADRSMNRRDAYLVVTLTWIVFSLFGTLPFLIGGYITSFTDAFFETMSGFTTTGATVILNVEELPHGILFWRSLMQWVGGLGIVFFTIAILPSFVGGSVQVFAAEATGPTRTKLHPRLSISTKAIWLIFFVLSAACMGAFKLLGMDWFDSVNYAMTTLATGGMAPHNDSILHFQSAGIEYTAALFCFLSGINFTLLYCFFIKFDVKKVVRSSELRFYVTLILAAIVLLTVMLMVSNSYSPLHALRSSVFQTISFATTTGLSNDDISTWPRATWIVLFVLMLIGACSGSTSSGLKCVRADMLLKIVRNEFRQILHPNAVLPVRVDQQNVPSQKRITLLAFITIYALVFLLCLFAMVLLGIDNTNAVTIAIGTINNVGPSLTSDVGLSTTWAALPWAAKWLCSLLMLMGRLEVFSVLVIFTPAFWKEN